MCNHYRKGQPVVGWSQVRLGGGLQIALAISEIAEHTYPKYPAPIVIQQSGARSLVTKSWGIPITVKGTGGKPLTKPVTNARNDKLGGYTWRYAAAERRCLIPATGYFEPGLGPVGAKGEILFTVRERPCFFLAGLWEGDAFTMVTTEPNEFVRTYHDRMPVVLHDADAETWLGDTALPDDLLARLCRGLPSEALLHETLPPRLKITRSENKTPPPDQQTTLL
jgi:putative SOS response-associated peptidase YedK